MRTAAGYVILQDEMSLPNRETILALEPEDLAGAILLGITSEYQRVPHRGTSIYNFTLPYQEDREVGSKLSAGFMWLIHQGLLTHDPGNQAGWCVPTKRGLSIETLSDFESFRTASLLPQMLLHPDIYELAFVEFARGDYSTAVFKVYRELEVSVRTAGGFEETDYGTPLMARAFDPENGPLTDKDNPHVSEREALRNLFTGAIGSYKNSHSHRRVKLDPDEAAEMIILADHLYRIVESRAG